MWYFEVSCDGYTRLTFIWLIISEMHEPGGNCNELMKKTVDALSSEQLQDFFVSTQPNNLDLCVEYGIKR